MKKILVCLVAVTAIFTASAQQTGKTEKTINVTGTAEMEVVPDEIYVQVELKEYDKKGVGKVDIEKIKNQFLEACKSIGLSEKEVSVQSFSGRDAHYWEYKRSKKQNPDMKASIVYSIKLADTRKMNELVDKLDDEATQSFFISRVSHSKLDEYKKQLKIEAIKAAKAKANYLAAAIDEQVGGAITINDVVENDVQPVIYPQTRMYANMSVAMDKVDEAMEVGFKKIKLQFSVSVTFALK
ncbi:hypothetical protein SAMN05421788_1117 [Filimonas lacunae]|uniref:DUF541 domain-containing protein n=1 Tax=Filimonas lacunae TaxID=477680 RepID=A0A173MB46_9BACT|nr:SIMPL domain-containing protein [Filimonas lacunae]BAV04793.1 hypothetical protein FLA_0792 [Filimonas lacunae]SIT32047.1 hypothetical protein SAMN05421788_1117 [Filimonas lacunae]